MIEAGLIANINLEVPKKVASSLFRRKESIKEETVELDNFRTGFNLDQNTLDGENNGNIHEFDSESTDVNNLDAGVEFPEGGLKAYLAVFGCFMGLIPTFGLINSVGTIQSYISQNQLSNVSASTISWIFTVNTFVTFASVIFSGALFDRNGSSVPLISGSIFFCAGLFATANATTMWQFIVTLSVVGLGNGILFSPLCGVVSHYFLKNRATALSVATTGGSIGGIVIPLMLRGLYPAVGFVWAIRILAFFSLFCLSWPLFFAKERFRSNEVKIHSVNEFFQTYVFNIFDYKALYEGKFLFCSLAASFAESGLIVSSVYFPSYVTERGYDDHLAYLLITVMNTTGILGRYIPGYLADKFIGRFNIAIITIFFCMVSNLTLWLPFGKNLNVLYAFSAIYGFFSGSILSLVPVCIGQISRTEEFGRRYSTMYLVVSFTSLAIIPIGGAIIGDSSIQSFNNFIIYVSCLMAAASLFYGISRAFCVGIKLCKF